MAWQGTTSAERLHVCLRRVQENAAGDRSR